MNANGLRLLDFCKQNTLHIANGRIWSGKGIGKYTFVAAQVKVLLPVS